MTVVFVRWCLWIALRTWTWNYCGCRISVSFLNKIWLSKWLLSQYKFFTCLLIRRSNSHPIPLLLRLPSSVLTVLNWHFILQKFIIQPLKVGVSQSLYSRQPISRVKYQNILHELDSSFGHFSEITLVKANWLFLVIGIGCYREFLASKEGFFLFFG